MTLRDGCALFPVINGDWRVAVAGCRVRFGEAAEPSGARESSIHIVSGESTGPAWHVDTLAGAVVFARHDIGRHRADMRRSSAACVDAKYRNPMPESVADDLPARGACLSSIYGAECTHGETSLQDRAHDLEGGANTGREKS
jgi:hypothetical protein